MSINFLQPNTLLFLPPEPKKQSNWLIKFFHISIITLSILAVLIVVGGLYATSQAKTIYQAALDGKDNLEAAQGYLDNLDLTNAALSFAKADDNFTLGKNNLNKFFILRIIPPLDREMKAVNNVLLAGQEVSYAGKNLTAIANQLINTLENADKKISLGEITAEQKKAALKILYNSTSTITEAKSNIDSALATLQEIPQDSLVFKQLKDSLAPLQDNLILTQDYLSRALTFTNILTSSAGYPEEKAYLFLLQNSSELRPTGGFIGTYGILKVKDGSIVSFKTDDIYALDGPSTSFFKIAPPAPLKKYLNVNYWYMRDGNWSPDFRESAVKAIWFYNQETKSSDQLDGVIAMTPEVGARLLGFFGEVNLDGRIFNQSNFTDALENEVGKNYVKEGILRQDRKDIVGALAQNIIGKVFSLPIERWPELASLITGALDEKHIMFYSSNPALQNIIAEKNWDNRVIQVPDTTDYLMVIDANMASLKTDPYVKRDINYTINQEDGHWVATAGITYQNQAKFTWKTTRYRTYTRLSVPKGSRLLQIQGSMENDKLHNPKNKPGPIDLGEENGKEYFGTFISIEPGETKTLSFKYQLPDSIVQEIAAGVYTLFVQKQAGTISHGLTLNLNFGIKIKTATPAEEQKNWGDTNYTVSSDLRLDRQFEVEFAD